MAIIAPLIGLGTAIVQSGVLSGGGDDALVPCPGQPTDEARFLLSVITPPDFELLRNVGAAGGALAAVESRDPVQLAKAVYGGRDCQVTTEAGRQFSSLFQSLVRKYGGDVSIPAQQPGGVIGTIGAQILQPLVTTAQNVAQGAVAGAAAAAQGAQAGSSITTGFTGALPVVLVLALAALILLPLLRRRS